MAVFSVTCPECGATLKASKPVPAGKSVTCPKCDVTFKTKDSQAATAVEVVEDEYDQVEIVDEVTAAKEMKTATAVKRRRPRQEFKKKSNPWPMILISSGSLLGVAGLAVAGYFLVKFLTTTRSGDPIAYVPPRAALMGGADLSKLITDFPETAAIAGFLEMMPPIASYKSETNLDVKSSLDKIMFAMNGSPQQPGAVTVALSSKTPLDKEKLAKALGATATTAGGRNAYQIGSDAYTKQILSVPTPSLAAFYTGNANAVDDAVRAGGRSNPRGEIAGLLNKAAVSHIWFVMDLSVPGARDMATSGPAMPGMRTEWMNNVSAWGMWATVAGSELEINQHFVAPDVNTAKSLGETLEKEQKAQKSNFALQMLFMATGATGAMKDAENSAKLEVQDKTVVCTARISMANVQKMISQMSKMPIPNIPMGPADPRGGRPGGGRPGGRP